MVRRIRFIYRKSFSRFENDPVFFWKVLEGSRRVRNKSAWKVGLHPPWPASLREEESQVDSSPWWPATPPKERGESHFP